MKKAIYVDFETFEETEQEFGDYHFELADEIRKFVKERFGCKDQLLEESGKAYITDIITDREGDKFQFAVFKARKDMETVAERYKIIIQKISDAS